MKRQHSSKKPQSLYWPMVSNLDIPVPSDFNFEECLWFLDRGYDECLYVIQGPCIFRLIRLKSHFISFKISYQPGVLTVETGSPLTSENELYLKEFISHWFDLQRDLSPFYSLLNKHEKLGYMASDFHGLRLVGIPDLFEALCWSIIGQQINLTFAYKLKRRLVELYGEKTVWNGVALYHFPTPEQLAGLDEDVLRSLQFSRGKINYLRNTAEAFASGKISLEKISALPDLLSRQAALTHIKGIGIWSANYALMKSLREPGSIPFGDVGLLQALQNHGVIHERNEQKKILELFENFKGWEAYLVFYLWRSLNNQKLK